MAALPQLAILQLLVLMRACDQLVRLPHDGKAVVQLHVEGRDNQDTVQKNVASVQGKGPGEPPLPCMANGGPD